jgi:hypothetical protein
MKTKFTNSDTASFLIQHLDKTIEINDKGQLAFKSLAEFDIAIDVLTENIAFAKTVVNVQRREIVRQAVIESKKADDFLAKRILSEIDQRQKRYLQRPIRRYVLLTSISISWMDQLRVIRLKRSALTFVRNRPPNFPLPDGGSLQIVDRTPTNYSYVKVYVQPKTHMKPSRLPSSRSIFCVLFGISF